MNAEQMPLSLSLTRSARTQHHIQAIKALRVDCFEIQIGLCCFWDYTVTLLYFLFLHFLLFNRRRVCLESNVLPFLRRLVFFLNRSKKGKQSSCHRGLQSLRAQLIV